MDDYRTWSVSAGPFQVDAGSTLGFQAALVIGRGFDEMLANAVQAQLTFDGAYLDCDEDPTTGVDGRGNKALSAALPGPVLHRSLRQARARRVANAIRSRTAAASWSRDTCVYVNAGLRGGAAHRQPNVARDGRECLIHWLTGTAAPRRP